MPSVKSKLESAFEALKKEQKKINPSAVEKRAGVANGSLKNHPLLREIVLAEKAKQQPNLLDKKHTESKVKSVAKERLNILEARNEKLELENKQYKAELKVMADSIAQLTWELHRYKTATRRSVSKVRSIEGSES